MKLDNTILQGKLTGSIFTIELLVDKINKTNPKGEWLEIMDDLKRIVETQKECSNLLYNLIDENEKKDKLLNKISFIKK